jgi:hypothetical protein
MVEDYGFTEPHAVLLLGQVAEARCTQLTNPNYTYVAKIAKSILWRAQRLRTFLDIPGRLTTAGCTNHWSRRLGLSFHADTRCLRFGAWKGCGQARTRLAAGCVSIHRFLGKASPAAEGARLDAVGGVRGRVFEPRRVR